jgi:hypothetical protein
MNHVALTSDVYRTAPIIKDISGDGMRYHKKGLYWRRFRSGGMVTALVNIKNVYPLDDNEGLIKFPWWFPYQLISESLTDDRKWSLWSQGHQWVGSFIWAKGPAAASGWEQWWEKDNDNIRWP